MITINSYSPRGTYAPKYSKTPINRLEPSCRVNFSGRPFAELYKEYALLTDCEKLKPLQAFLKLSDDTKSMDDLLSGILLQKEKGYEFVRSLMAEPRKLNEYADAIASRIGSGSQNFMTFLPNSPYRIAYSGFIDKTFKNAGAAEELLRLRPDWKGEKLLEKHRALNGDVPFELGAIPVEIPREHLFGIADYLKNFMQSGYKQRQNIAPLNLQGKNYSFEFFVDGKTDKNVFGVSAENGNNYIIKMANADWRSLDNPYSLGTLAKIDTYLTQNGSRNTAPLYYYNHDRNFLVYGFVNHTQVAGDTNNLSVIMEHIPDFKALGLKYNDNVGSNNCFLLDEKSNELLKRSVGFADGVSNKEWVSVDNDHVEYSCRLQPQISGYHASLPNAMGMF